MSMKYHSYSHSSHMTTPYHLTSESCMAFVRACPRWRLPVTLGGGRVIMKRPLGFGSSALLRWMGEEDRHTLIMLVHKKHF